MKPEFLPRCFFGIGAFLVLLQNQKKKKIGDSGRIQYPVLLAFPSCPMRLNHTEKRPYLHRLLLSLAGNPVLAVLAGAVVTAIIQSSSASVGILQTLALNGVVNWQSAVFITLGQNIGTCVTALISSAGPGKCKRASVIHLLFNVIGAVVFGIIMFVPLPF